MLADYNHTDPGASVRLWLALLLYGGIVLAGLLVNLALCFRPDLVRTNWRQRIRILQNRPWRWSDLGWLVGVLLSLQALVLLATRYLAPLEVLRGSRETAANAWFVVQSCIFHLTGLGLLAALRYRRHLRWRRAFGLPGCSASSRFRLGLIAYAASMPLVLFSALASYVLLTYWGYATRPQDIAAFMMFPRHPLLQVFVVVMTVVIAPAFEELLFRGLALPLLARRFGIGPAVFITAAIFAAIHFHLPSLAPLFVIAVAFALAYLYSGSLWTPYVMHALFNGVNLILLWLMRDGMH